MNLRFLRPSWADQFPELVAVQTTRSGGGSKAPFDSLNLGLHTDDDPAEVQKNRAIVAAALGFAPAQLSGGHQVHGDEIASLSAAGQYDGCDAFISDRQGLLLSVTIADCVPVLIWDPVRRVVAAAHAGWKGTAAEIAAKTVSRMAKDYGTLATDCWAFIGAAIGFDDFEVGPEVAAHFAGDLQKGPDERGKYFVDLKAANRQQLERAGLLAERIDLCTISSLAQADLIFSHRASGDGRTGRGLALIGYSNKSN